VDLVIVNGVVTWRAGHSAGGSVALTGFGLARPAASPAGLAITAAALLVMPALAAAKRRTGRAGQPHPGRRLR
jgi:hypothetical protein